MSRHSLIYIAVAALAICPFPVLAETHQVTIGDNFFSPNDLTINVGDTVRWTYSGSRQHDVTADDSSWASPTSNSIDFSRTFNSVEEVLYHCSVHSRPGRDINVAMNGRINVVDNAANQPPEADFTFDCADLGCAFTDISSDADGTIASWAWDFDDGGSSSQQNPDHAFTSAGTYAVSLTVTDDGGAQDTISRNVTVSDPPEDPPVTINLGMMDAWFDPATNGQGFLITVYEQSGIIFLAWFTFDTERPPEGATAIFGEAGHRWITASGPYANDTAILDVFLSTDGTLDSPEPPIFTNPEPYGTIVIQWTSCNSAVLTYEIPSLDLLGEIDIQRAFPENVPVCEAGQNPAP
jgi:PKD repeat protein